MMIKLTAWILSFLSFFAFWNPQGQPNRIPETREYAGEVPDKYGIWPTEEFTGGKAPLWFSPEVLKTAYTYIKGLRLGGMETHSMLVLHKGKLIYEDYAEGWDKDTPHFMASVTKSFLSALVGIAIGEGKIKGADQKVIEFYPDAVIAEGQESKKDMTIEHLLTMTSGLPGDSDASDWAWWDAPDISKAAFETPQLHAPGVKYSYNSGPGCQTLAGIVCRAVGMSLYDYAQEKLFGPLGMTSVTWDQADDGSYFGGFGLNMTPRDMARFGYLYLNYGRWENKQILPADWVVQSGPRSKASYSYGRMFWNYDLLPFGDAYEANGAVGQFINIIPAMDMVIVRTGGPGAFDEFIVSVKEKLGIV